MLRWFRRRTAEAFVRKKPVGDRRYSLAGNHATYERILALARHQAPSRPDLAAAWAETAADHAWKCHPGFFVDERMEQLLASLGAQNASGGVARGRPKSPQSVLHVVTEAYTIGGHTRLAWRWIVLDRSRRHSVVLTRQGHSFPVPEALTTAVGTAGGFVRALDWQQYPPLTRAEHLRGLATDFDVVVVHAHPFDIVPAIAFAGSGGPPVILLNHASIAFWVGRETADVVACLRPSSHEVATSRRGIHPSRCPLLPIPVERPAKGPSRSEARVALGVPHDAVLLFTVASPYKYIAFEPGPSFIELILSLALAHDRAHVVAIGPTDEGAWRQARKRTGGRIRALGSAQDVDLHARAADVYLDSFPVTSPTSFLETGRYGAPIVSLSSYACRAPVLCADDAWPDGFLVHMSPDSFVEEMGRLIEDAPYREALGRATADAILAGHGPEAFVKNLDSVYTLAALVHEGGRAPATASGHHGSLDECLVRMQNAAKLSMPLEQIVELHLDAFPLEFRESVRLEASVEHQFAADDFTKMGR
jgi:hypothetical protein